jgi:two-component sensor histidine kinase
MGLRLVSDLARQLGGRLQIGTGPGAVFEVVCTDAGGRGDVE